MCAYYWFMFTFCSYLLRPVIVFFSRCVFFAGGFHHIKVFGRRAQAKEAAILVMAPHSSYMDALPIVYLDLTSNVAKSENGQVPVFGSMRSFYRSLTFGCVMSAWWYPWLGIGGFCSQHLCLEWFLFLPIVLLRPKKRKMFRVTTWEN